MKSLLKTKLLAALFLFFSLFYFSLNSHAQHVFFHMLGIDRLQPYTWVGYGTDANWTTPQNWSDNAAPGLSDTARFITSACSSNCSPTINTSISIGGISVDATYPGTITQAPGQAIIVGSAGWTQAGGTFVGNNANITINSTFSLTGGTFTSTSAQMLVTSGFVSVGGTFLHNNGLLRFDNNGIVAANSTINVSVPANLELWNLQYSGGYNSSNGTYKVNLASGSFNVLSDFRIGLTVAGALGTIYASGGSIEVKGNLILDPSAKLEANTNPSNVILNGTGAQTYSSTSGRLPNLIINKPSGAVTPLGGSINLTVESFTNTSGSFTAPPSSFIVLGNFTISGGTYLENSSSMQFERYSDGGTNFTISLANALNVTNLTFGGGQPVAATPITWTLAGATPRINASGNLGISNTQAGSGAVTVNGGEIYLSGNYLAGAHSGAGTTALTFNGTGAQSFNKSGAGSNLAGSMIVDKASGTLTLATVANINSSGQNFTITNGIVNMAGFGLNVGSTLTIGVNGRLICNGGTPTYSSVVINGEVSCGPSIGITWTGLAANNQWSTVGNWTNNTVPTASDVALFNSKCTGPNCNSSMPASVSVRGLRLNSDYPGTLTAGTTVTIGTSGYIQAGGTYNGVASTKTVGSTFTLSGGTYTATSGTTTINATSYNTTGTAVFNHSSGTFNFSYPSWNTTTNIAVGTENYWAVIVTGSYTSINLTGELNVLGPLTLEGTHPNSSQLLSGVISAKNNVTIAGYGMTSPGTLKISGSSNQSVTISGVNNPYVPSLDISSTGGTVTMTGIFRLHRNFTHNSGTVSASASTLFFEPDYAAAITVKGGSEVYGNVTFRTNQGDVSLNGDLIIGGTLNFHEKHSIYGGYMSGPGRLISRGDVNYLGGGMKGEAFVVISGSVNQTIFGESTAFGIGIEFAKSGGVASLTGRIPAYQNLVYTSGTVNAGTSTVDFNPGYIDHATWTPGSIPFNHVRLAGQESNLTIIGSLTVLGTLTLDDSNGQYAGEITGTILASGDVVVNRGGKKGAGLIRFVGSTDQTLLGNGYSDYNWVPNIEFASTGGVIYLSGNIRTNRNIVYSTGTLNAGSSSIELLEVSQFTPGPAMYNDVKMRPRGSPGTTLTGSLKTAGLLWHDGLYGWQINTGTFEINGDFLISNNGVTGSSQLQFRGATSSVIQVSGSGIPSHPGSLITVDKSVGSSVTLASNLGFNTGGADLRVIAGTLNMAGSDLTVNDNVTIDSSGTLICNGGTLTRASLTNNGVFDCSSTSFNWTGAGGNSNWNNASNWSGAVVPGVNDVALFSNTFCGSNCNATLNVDPNVKGIRLASDYTGTITQGSAVPVTIGSQGWVQINGKFIGSNANINLNGNIILSGGTYTATSAATITGYGFAVNNRPVFNSNFGTFTFTGATNGNIVSKDIRFHHVNLTGSNARFSLFGGSVFIDGNLNVGDSVSGSGGIDSGTLVVNGNVNFVNFGYTGSANLTFFGGTASTLNIGASASVVSGDITVEKLAMLTLNSAATFTNSSAQIFRLLSGVINLNGFNLNTRAMYLSNYTGIVCRGGTYTNTSFQNDGAVLACAGYPYFWTGAGANANWNTAANWSGGVVPVDSATQVAIFSNANCSSNCNPTLNVNPNVRGLYMMPDYTGTITQAPSVQVNIGAFGINQAGGSFLGSNANMTLYRRVFFGAGTFRATSATTTVLSGAPYDPVYAGLGISTNFQHNNGTFNFDFSCTNHKAHLSRVHTFYNVRFINSCTGVEWSGTEVTVANDLTMDMPGYQTIFNNLRLKVAGNLSTGQFNGNGAIIEGTYVIELIGRPAGQIVSFTGANGRMANLEINTGVHPVTIQGVQKIGRNYTYISSGTFTTTGSTLFFETNGYYSESITIVPGSVNYNNVDIMPNHYGAFIIQGTMNVLGNLTLRRGGYGTNNIDSGVLAVSGNVILIDGAYNAITGTATVRLTGNPAGQIISGPLNVNIPNLVIATGSHAVSISGTPRVNGSTQVISGVVSQTAGSIFRTTSLALGGNTWTKSTGSLIVNGVTAGTGALFGGTVNP